MPDKDDKPIPIDYATPQSSRPSATARRLVMLGCFGAGWVIGLVQGYATGPGGDELLLWMASYALFFGTLVGAFLALVAMISMALLWR